MEFCWDCIPRAEKVCPSLQIGETPGATLCIHPTGSGTECIGQLSAEDI